MKKKAMENEEIWRRSGRMSAVVVADDWLRAGAPSLLT